jgi:hypothetical protein
MNVHISSLLSVILAVVSFSIIILIFRMCKYTKNKTIENFSSIEDLIKKKHLKEKLLNIEKFVSIEEIDDIETKTMDVLKDIQSMKDKIKEKEYKDSFDEEAIEDELMEIIVEEEEEEEEKEEEEKEEEKEEKEEAATNDEDNDIEGFVEHTTHSCGMV